MSSSYLYGVYRDKTWHYSFLFYYDQVSLATDFAYNYLSRDVVASLGYDYILRQVTSPISMELKNKQEKNAFLICIDPW